MNLGKVEIWETSLDRIVTLREGAKGVLRPGMEDPEDAIDDRSKIVKGMACLAVMSRCGKRARSASTVARRFHSGAWSDSMGKQPSLEVGVTHYHIPPNHRRAGIGVRLTNVKQSLDSLSPRRLAACVGQAAYDRARRAETTASSEHSHPCAGKVRSGKTEIGKVSPLRLLSLSFPRSYINRRKYHNITGSQSSP